MEDNRFAQRTNNLAPSSIRKIMAIAKQLVHEGKTVYELNIGQPDVSCISIFPEAIGLRARAGHIKYAPFIGETFLRETYSRYLNNYFDRNQGNHLVIDTANVLVTAGASHALTNTFLAICNPGDEILCIEPFFPPYAGFLQIAGGKINSVPTFAEDGFRLPSDEDIEKQITPRTKAILFNSPCNPSGKIFSEEEVTRIARIAIKHNIFLISDEVYRELVLGEKKAFSLLQVNLNEEEMQKYKDLLIVIDSASKSFSLCGARIGFVVSQTNIIEKIALINAHTVACVSDIMQFGVAVAYDHVLSKPDYFDNLRQVYRERLEATMDAIHTYLPDVVAPRPDGAFYIMLQFPDLDDINEYVYFMLERFNLGGETVAVTPAGGFYKTEGRGDNEIRLALVLSPEKMRRSIEIMSKAYLAFKEYKGYQGKNSL